METFILVMVGILALDIAGKVMTLYTRDFTRKAGIVAAEALINGAFLLWGVWVLAHA